MRGGVWSVECGERGSDVRELERVGYIPSQGQCLVRSESSAAESLEMEMHSGHLTGSVR